MKDVYNHIIKAIESRQKLLAVLIDPDKFSLNQVEGFVSKVNASIATHIFVGGSTVKENDTEVLVERIKHYTHLPIVLFPGDVTQITNQADALLFLSLISGRNPDYLIGKHIKAVSLLENSNLEVIPTGYLLIENGKQTAVERVTNTLPMSRKDVLAIQNTTKAGALLGMKLIYLEAGSGALEPITSEIITAVKQDLKIPLIVGGGIRNKCQLYQAFNAGADLVVVGTAFEENESFFQELLSKEEQL